jgi:sulfatase modifying factor 1
VPLQAVQQADGWRLGKNTWTAEPADHESDALNCIDWFDAFAFCVWDGGRLPTEAEWEYAAAGGDENRRYPWGSVFRDGLANVGGIDGYVMGVGRAGDGQSRGRFGHYDLLGNVWEWTRDVLTYYPAQDAGLIVDPVEPIYDDGYAVIRGFSFFRDPPELFSVRYRSWWPPRTPNNNIGFRCAREGPSDSRDAAMD